jgi:hypothetical protein
MHCGLTFSFFSWEFISQTSSTSIIEKGLSEFVGSTSFNDSCIFFNPAPSSRGVKIFQEVSEKFPGFPKEKFFQRNMYCNFITPSIQDF